MNKVVFFPGMPEPEKPKMTRLQELLVELASSRTAYCNTEEERDQVMGEMKNRGLFNMEAVPIGRGFRVSLLFEKGIYINHGTYTPS